MKRVLLAVVAALFLASCGNTQLSQSAISKRIETLERTNDKLLIAYRKAYDEYMSQQELVIAAFMFNLVGKEDFPALSLMLDPQFYFVARAYTRLIESDEEGAAADLAYVASLQKSFKDYIKAKAESKSKLPKPKNSKLML